MGRLDNRVALVTGAASGLGQGIAEAYGREGALVAALDRNRERLGSVAEGIRQAGGRVRTYVADVSDAAEVEQAANAAIADHGRIDILVNCAGIVTQAPLHQMPVDMWDQMIAVNLRSVFLCTRFVVPQMMAQGSGRIINMASQLGYKGAAELVHYSAAKGGVIAFTRALARELAPHITVNAIAPGPIETALLADISPEWRAMKEAELPLGRFGQVHEVAPTAVFLACDDASYYTGQTLGPNGGDVMI